MAAVSGASRRRWLRLWMCLGVCLCVSAPMPAIADQDEDIPHNEVKNWALKFGVDLWEFGRQFTKMNEIQRKYHDAELEVVRKDGLILIREMASEVKNMMDFKMAAVQRIMDSAEQAALSPQSQPEGGPVRYYDSRKLNVFGADGRIASGSREMALTPSRHFDQLPVNTSLSSVLMPPTISETDPEVLSAIQWSEHLDPLFANNYEIDPGLSWQYFGSSSGFMRRFPGTSWPPDDPAYSNARGVYDFRASQWFVRAATSPKDLVLLLDTSGSMSGFRSGLARSTVFAILDTLGENDFVNVFRFDEVTEELVPCFKDSLVQANSDNIRELKNAVDGAKQENIANFTSAMVQAFDILNKYNRTGLGCQCNQAIMLITDGPSGNHREVVQRCNWPHKPVRLFTYLVGSDSRSAQEMHWMACNNKGFYSHIGSAEEAREKVLHYLYVMARPMVMYQNDHPMVWSSVYMGGKSNSLVDKPEGQLMTSVTTPIFDRRNHSVRVANLLGVVGTDVPIEQIQKLVPSYKLGVNGYSFIVNNNGHVLYHPDLRPLFTQSLQPSYTSVDLTELELVEHEATPRENHSILLDLRHDMIEQKEGETELGVKVHYDGMRRAATRRNKYFYHPIEGTPFSLAVVLPEGYGMYELLAEQEIRHSPVNVTEYFKGTNWKVNPDWVYCEYNSASEQWFTSPEEQLLHFLSRAGRPGWKWLSMRPRSHHAHKKVDKDAYFCDKTLVQSLVRDAIVTEGLDRHPTHATRKEDKHQGYQMFGVTLSFIATRSGLLRWTEHTPPSATPIEPHFSSLNQRAMSQSWYKRAVDQHSVEPESFVFSVDFADDPRIAGGVRPLVTATHAVFVEHKGHRAPAAVVGLQFQHATLAGHFINITSACTGTAGNCRKTCASEDLDCYLLDNNGFIILSEDASHTGRFFGQIDGTIMDSLVQDRIYKKVPVFDYQGACAKDRNPYSGAGMRLAAYQPLRWLLNWASHWLVLWLSLLDTAQARAYSFPSEEGPVYNDDYDNTEYGSATEDERHSDPPGTPPPAPQPAQPPAPPLNRAGARPCDRRTDLYVLQPERLNTSGMSNPLKGKLTNCHVTGCERPFSVQKIPHSNLILLVVDTLCPCGSKQLHISSVEVQPGSADAPAGGHVTCRHTSRQHLYRRRPPKCINYHPEETEIQQCGRGNALTATRALLAAAVCIVSVTQYHVTTT